MWHRQLWLLEVQYGIFAQSIDTSIAYDRRAATPLTRWWHALVKTLRTGLLVPFTLDRSTLACVGTIDLLLLTHVELPASSLLPLRSFNPALFTLTAHGSCILTLWNLEREASWRTAELCWRLGRVECLARNLMPAQPSWCPLFSQSEWCH